MSRPFAHNDDLDFPLKSMMGPKTMRITEDLANFLRISPGMRILDLEYGMGISSIVLMLPALWL